jgi:hypothetical protein
MQNALHQARELREIVVKRLQSAESLLGAGLLRLSLLDAEISKLCIQRAELSLARAEAEAFASIEMTRRLAAARIEELRRLRKEAEAECERLRGETRDLLRRKISLDAAIGEIEDEKRRRRRHA